MYHLILKNSDEFKEYSLSDNSVPLLHLPNFNKINIIVGANNSGKSRFMRKLIGINEYTIIDVTAAEQYNEIVNDYNIRILKDGYTRLEFIDYNDTIDEIVESNIGRLKENRYGYVQNYRNKFNSLLTLSKSRKVLKKYYIPTLRTAHSLYKIDKPKIRATYGNSGTPAEYSKVGQDLYLQTLNKYYDLDDVNVDIFTGVNFYKEVLNSRNSEKKIRNQFENFEKFLSRNFFDGKQIDIVANFNKDENEKGKSDSELILIHVESEDVTRKLYDLGDGIQALIILMYKIFMADKDSIFFIDEPELHLHPGMQRLFLEQICNNKVLKEKNLTFFITTHSNHFLDLTIQKDNVSIYSFSSEILFNGSKKFNIRNVNLGDNQLLKHLGVNNSSVFLANSSIWVEGVSDRNYIKAFLKSYLAHLLATEDIQYKSIKEDIDYAFFEYAGSNIEHYVFNDIIDDTAEKVINEIKALALSNKIYLLADSDLADKRGAKGKRLMKLEDSKTQNFVPNVIWEIREIENLLTNRVWRSVIRNFVHKDLTPIHDDEIGRRIDKVFSELNAIKFERQYIGAYLSEVREKLGEIDGKVILNKSIYEDKKDGNFGSFIPKRELSELVLNEEFEWEVLAENPRIEKLTKHIYSFITTDM